MIQPLTAIYVINVGSELYNHVKKTLAQANELIKKNAGTKKRSMEIMRMESELDYMHRELQSMIIEYIENQYGFIVTQKFSVYESIIDDKLEYIIRFEDMEMVKDNEQ